MDPAPLEPSLHDAARGVPSGYRDSRGLARIAQVLLALNPILLVGTFVLAIVASVVAAAAGEPFALTESIVTAADLAELGLRFATAAAFIAWLHRATKNMHALGGTAPEGGIPIAILGWFIPCANFWLPFQVVSEVERRSREDVVVGEASSPLVSAWWGTWVVTLLLLNAASRVTDESASLLIAAALMVAELASATLAILVIHRIQRNQAALALRRDAHALAATFE